MSKKAYESAINLLAVREYAKSDLHRRLTQKGYSEDVVQFVLNSLSEQGLQSDQRFAEVYIRSRKARGYGLQRIRVELQQKRISDHIISTFLQETAEDWQNQILNVWNKKFRGKKPEDLSERAKQFRFLQYRGFSVDQIQWLLQNEN